MKSIFIWHNKIVRIAHRYVQNNVTIATERVATRTILLYITYVFWKFIVK